MQSNWNYLSMVRKTKIQRNINDRAKKLSISNNKSAGRDFPKDAFSDFDNNKSRSLAKPSHPAYLCALYTNFEENENILKSENG